MKTEFSIANGIVFCFYREYGCGESCFKTDGVYNFDFLINVLLNVIAYVG